MPRIFFEIVLAFSKWAGMVVGMNSITFSEIKTYPDATYATFRGKTGVYRVSGSRHLAARLKKATEGRGLTMETIGETLREIRGASVSYSAE